MRHLQGNVELFQVFQEGKQESKTLGRLVFWHMLSGSQHREGAPRGGLNQGGAGGGEWRGEAALGKHFEEVADLGD